jgi:hypothetical protein
MRWVFLMSTVLGLAMAGCGSEAKNKCPGFCSKTLDCNGTPDLQTCNTACESWTASSSASCDKLFIDMVNCKNAQDCSTIAGACASEDSAFQSSCGSFI